MEFELNGNLQGKKRRIAVIGSGISGLSAAWLLSKSASVKIYEADSRLGGHANTVTVPLDKDNAIPVDTGFIVYNERNYPNLVALFSHLGVATEASEMSFSASLAGGKFEYSGSGVKGLLGQKSNALKPRFWRMVSDIMRFYKQAPILLDDPKFSTTSLGDYLDQNHYSKTFIDDHLLPMGAAIWSTTATDMRAYPLQAFIRFFVSHGLILLSGRPQWRTVSGGSREYVKRLMAEYTGTVELNCHVAAVRRTPECVKVVDRTGNIDIFDDVVIATHADHALAMLADPDDDERSLLGSFQYTRNAAVLHSDPALMPRRKSVWASWNYIGEAEDNRTQQLCVTYWMNRLQNIDPSSSLFVTLNPSRAIDPAKIIRAFDYTHPLFDNAALAAQRKLWSLQGQRNTWFCGAHFGSGFHEDGLQSGLAVAEALGGIKRPWSVANESGRIFTEQQKMAAE